MPIMVTCLRGQETDDTCQGVDTRRTPAHATKPMKSNKYLKEDDAASKDDMLAQLGSRCCYSTPQPRAGAEFLQPAYDQE